MTKPRDKFDTETYQDYCDYIVEFWAEANVKDWTKQVEDLEFQLNKAKVQLFLARQRREHLATGK